MLVYLPIAEMPVHAVVIELIALSVGLLSGFFGVGGGFLTSPLLYFAGVPLPIAIGTQNAQVLSSGISAVISHWRKKQVDWLFGGLLAFGGVIGSVVGVLLFRLLIASGQLTLIVSLCYIVLLSFVGITMIGEFVSQSWPFNDQKNRSDKRRKRRQLRHRLLLGAPFRMRFPRSRLYMSVLAPLGISMAVGCVAAMLGIGGSVVTVPLLIYFFGVPARVVVGTALIPTVFVSLSALFFQTTVNHSVDVILALLLIVGGAVGAQIGVFFGRLVQPSSLRGLLAVTVLTIAVFLSIQILIEPSERFTLLLQR